MPDYHITPAAALVEVEFHEVAGAARRASGRGGKWFEFSAAHDCQRQLSDLR
jgi:hypothetical protein